MARDLPAPTPEGALIRRVRQSIRPRLSVPAAAERAGISEMTWGNVERGYRTAGRKAEPIRVVATAQTLAHMAYAVGLTPGDLDDVGRGDAAAILREMEGPATEVETRAIDQGRVTISVPPGLPEEDRQTIVRLAEQLAKDLAERRHRDAE